MNQSLLSTEPMPVDKDEGMMLAVKASLILISADGPVDPKSSRAGNCGRLLVSPPLPGFRAAGGATARFFCRHTK